MTQVGNEKIISLQERKGLSLLLTLPSQPAFVYLMVLNNFFISVIKFYRGHLSS